MMEQCQALLPTLVITTITADDNVNLSLNCMEKLQTIDEGQKYEGVSSLFGFFNKVLTFY